LRHALESAAEYGKYGLLGIPIKTKLFLNKESLKKDPALLFVYAGQWHFKMKTLMKINFQGLFTPEGR